jgi:hypothetical protein
VRLQHRHNLIEHDASLSRADAALGDNLHFNETIFATLANSNPGVAYYNSTSAGAVQRERLAISLATNPDITNTPKEFIVRCRESAAYLSVMGDPLTGVAPKTCVTVQLACFPRLILICRFVQIFFREERLPIAEGWKRPNTMITGATLAPIEVAIGDASDWTATQQCEDLVLGPDLVL